MLILQDDYLNIDRIDVVFLIIIEQLSLERNSVPTTWFLQFKVLYFLEILHIVSSFDGDLGRSIGLIRLEVEEHA